jgi:hypothetical protein
MLGLPWYVTSDRYVHIQDYHKKIQICTEVIFILCWFLVGNVNVIPLIFRGIANSSFVSWLADHTNCMVMFSGLVSEDLWFVIKLHGI